MVTLFVGTLIVLKSLDYFNPNFEVGFLSDKEAVFHGIYKTSFYLHIIFSPIALLIAIYQGLFKLRWISFHRIVGKTFVVLNLILVAPSGLIMSFYAYGGILGKMSFFLLSIFLFFFTFLGYEKARKGEIHKHKIWMRRTFILLLSAISLRVLFFIFNHYTHWSGEEMYITASWLSWMTPLIIHEVICFSRRKLRVD